MVDIESKKEAILDELNVFEKQSKEINQIPELLEEYLNYIVRTGDPLYPWCKIKQLIKKKVELVIDEFNEKYPSNLIPDLPNVRPFDLNDFRQELIENIDSFYGSPFTLQRICELLIAPYKHYKRLDKYMRGLEKNILVVSTIEPRSQSSQATQNSNHKSFFLSSPSSSYQNNPSSSSSSASSSQSSSSFVNGLHENSSISSPYSDYCDQRSSLHHSASLGSHISPAPLQQLDSFTTVFVSPPSTPLAVVSDLAYDNGNASLSPEHIETPATTSQSHDHQTNNNNNNTNNLTENNHLDDSQPLDDQEPCSSSSTESGNESPLDSSPELNSQSSDNEEKSIEESTSSSSSSLPSPENRTQEEDKENQPDAKQPCIELSVDTFKSILTNSDDTKIDDNVFVDGEQSSTAEKGDANEEVVLDVEHKDDEKETEAEGNSESSSSSKLNDGSESVPSIDHDDEKVDDAEPAKDKDEENLSSSSSSSLAVSNECIHENVDEKNKEDTKITQMEISDDYQNIMETDAVNNLNEYGSQNKPQSKVDADDEEKIDVEVNEELSKTDDEMTDEKPMEN